MKKAFLSFAMICVALISVSCNNAPKNDQIGLQLYSVRNNIDGDVPSWLEKVAGAGYTLVEAASYNNEQGTFYGMPAEEFAALCQSKGLNFISSHINGPDPNVASAEECEQWWTKAIASHKAAGCKYIVQPSMRRSAYESLEGLAKYCELFNKVGAMCNAQGIKFGYHNHSGEFTTILPDAYGNDVRVYDYMLANIAPENAFFQIDLYWIYRGGCDAIEYFKANPGRFLLWHVKDEVEVGASGQIDFPEIYKYASLSGMEYQIIEQEGYNDQYDPFESIKISCDYVKTLLPE